MRLATGNSHFPSGNLPQASNDFLVIALDQGPRPLEELLRPAGAEQHQLEAVGNFFEAILDGYPSHSLVSTSSDKTLDASLNAA